MQCALLRFDVSHSNMTCSRNGGDGRRGYHHGNLREALIEGALRLIAEKGPTGFTIAEAARSAGVSSAAPYRHFRDREELVADVARRGFERFADALSRAWDEGRPSPMDAFVAMGGAYLAFARDEPAYYAAMFTAGVPHEIAPELRAASDRSFGVLLEAAKTLATILPDADRPPPMMVAAHVWAMAHGVASLFGGPNCHKRKLPMSAEDLLEAGILLYLRGLGLAGGSLPPAP
jgi:AcrR family transcriptional regulator